MPAPPAAVVTARDERRYAAIIFADVSGFTSMSHEVDPETVHDLMNECLAGLGRAIHDEDGYVDKYIGDCVMGVFGAPIAHEDDPQRACRAALAMQAFIREFSRRTGSALTLRVGVNFGLVVAGSVGHDSSSQYTVMGDTVNVASRLETAAEPGTILVSDSVHTQARNGFEFGPRQAITVKGKPEPIGAHPLVAALEHELERERHMRAPRLVAREAELAALEAWLAQTRGRGGWIEVRGEAGVGKTRLVREAGLRTRDRRLLQVSATNTTRVKPFALLRRIIHDAVTDLRGDTGCLADADSLDGLLRDLDEGLLPYRNALWYIASTAGEAATPPDPDPQSLRRTVERGAEAFLEAFARRRPDAVLFIDGHEMTDDATAALLARLAQAGGPPVPTVAAIRSPFDTDPVNPDMLIALDALDRDDAGALLDLLVRDAELPGALRRQILDRADGVPLFLEEMVGVLMASGALSAGADDAPWSFDATRSGIEIPPTLHAALICRLDRLDAAERDLLSQCAVQGVEFCLSCADWVRREPPWAGPPLPPLVDNLQHRRIVRDPPSGSDPQRRVFARQLMQQAAYETLLLRSRRALHARVADAITHLAGGDAGALGEVLAFHEERAERWDRAAAANLHAGDHASDVFMNDEALERYANVVRMAGRVAEPGAELSGVIARAYCGAAQIHLRLGAYDEALAAAQHVTGADGTPDGPLAVGPAEAMRLEAAALAATGRTDEAAERLADVVARLAPADAAGTDVLSAAWHDLALLHYRAGSLDEAIGCIGRSRETPSANPRLATLQADLLEGRVLHTRGRFEDARATYLRAQATASELGSLSHSGEASNRIGSTAHDEGAYEAAQEHYARALIDWTRTGNVERIAGVHNNLGNVAMSVGDLALATDHFRRAHASWVQIGNRRGEALAHANLALLALERDDADGAVRAAEKSLETIGTSGDDLLRGLVRVVLGEGHQRAGRADAARASFDEVLETCTEDDHPLAVAGAERGRGRLALAAGDAEHALPELRRACARFESLKRTQEHARTRVSLAEALIAAGHIDDARRELDAAEAAFRAMRADRDIDRVRVVREGLPGR